MNSCTTEPKLALEVVVKSIVLEVMFNGKKHEAVLSLSEVNGPKPALVEQPAPSNNGSSASNLLETTNRLFKVPAKRGPQKMAYEEVMNGIIEGLDASEIAKKYGVSESAVQYHLSKKNTTFSRATAQMVREGRMKVFAEGASS